jgi:hypothetical protein
MTQPEIQNKTSSAPNHSGWRITFRDLDILVAIYRFRFLTRQLIEWVFFSGSSADPDRRSSASGRRLQALYEAGYVERLVLPMLPGAGRAPLVYALSSRGADAVAGHLGIDRANVGWVPRYNRATPLFVDHTLAIGRLWASLTAALRGTRVEIRKWVGEGELRRLKRRVEEHPSYRWLPVRPDGYFELWWPENHVRPCFVEIDMGTETNATIHWKMRAYHAYRRDGFERDYGRTSFWVLIVTSSDRRLDNLRRTVRKATDDDFCLFALLDGLHPSRVVDEWWRADGQAVYLVDV